MKADDLEAVHDFIGDFAQRIGGLMGRATALAFELERLEHVDQVSGDAHPRATSHHRARAARRARARAPKAPAGTRYAAGTGAERFEAASASRGLGRRDLSPTGIPRT